MIGLLVYLFIFIFIFYYLAVKCPAIRTDGGVTASGNTDEGSYGDLINFECVSTDKKIDGSSGIHCTETGEWSDSVPTCKGSFHCLIYCLFISSPTDHIFLCFIQCTNLPIPLSFAFHTEITCTAPVIQDGYVVEKIQEYQKDARLKYRCYKGFKPKEGIPKCSKFGWTLKPECDGNAPLLLHNKLIIWEIILKSLYPYVFHCAKNL